MSAEPAPIRRRLVSVDGDSGEVVSREVAALHERIESLLEVKKDLEADLVAKRAQITRMKRDKVAERANYARREDVVRVHQYWQKRLGRTKGLATDAFDAIRAMMEETRLEIADGKARKVPVFEYPADFKAAIDGAWFDPFCKPMKNGKVKRYDELVTIFGSAKSMQSFIERAPIRPVVAPAPDARNNQG